MNNINSSNTRIYKNNHMIKYIFIGTICDKDSWLSIISTFDKYYSKDIYLLEIIYDGIIGTADFKRDFEQIINNNLNIIVKSDLTLTNNEIYNGIMTSDIALCSENCIWKDVYKKHNLKLISISQKVAVVANISNCDKIDNLLKNYEQQLFINKKLFVTINNFNNKQMLNDYLNNANIDFQICENYENNPDDMSTHASISTSMLFDHISQCFDTCAYFDENSIYDKNYLIGQLHEMDTVGCKCITHEQIVIYSTNNHEFYNVITDKTNYVNTLIFSLNTYVTQNKINSFDEIIDNIVRVKECSDVQVHFSKNLDNYIKIGRLTEVIDGTIYKPTHINGQIFNFVFDKIFVINMRKDILKRRIFLTNNRHCNIIFSFYEGVHGATDTECLNLLKQYMDNPVCYDGCHHLEKKVKWKIMAKVGQYGYSKTMVGIFETSIEHNYKKIIVFDDDAILDKKFNEMFNDNLKLLKNNHIIRIGASHHDIKKYRNITKPFYESTNPDGSFAVCYTHKCFHKLIELTKCYNVPFDSGPLNDYKTFVNEKAIDHVIFPNLCIADVFVSETNCKNKSLKLIANKLLWKLDNFRIIDSLRKVSIVIMSHNNEKTILKSLMSIKNQTYKNMEIVIIDNNSTDSTNQIIEKFVCCYGNLIEIRHIRNNIRHDNNTMCQVALEIITGHYIMFHEPNHYSQPERIEKQINIIIRKDCKITFCNYKIVNDSYVSQATQLLISTILIDVNLCKKYDSFLNSMYCNNIQCLYNMYVKETNVNANVFSHEETNEQMLDMQKFKSFILTNTDTKSFIFYDNNTYFYAE